MNSKTTGTAAMQALSQNYQFNLSDFALFLSVMKNKTAYESTLSIILDEPDLKLTEVEVEQVSQPERNGSLLKHQKENKNMLYVMLMKVTQVHLWTEVSWKVTRIR